MKITINYDNGRRETFDSSSLVSTQPFGHATLVTEFDLRLDLLTKGDLVVDIHHYDDTGEGESGSVPELERRCGRRCKIADRTEVPHIKTIYADEKAIAWSQGGALVDAERFEYACSLYYSGKGTASNNYRALWLHDYLTFAHPEIADDAEICQIFGYPLAAYQDAEACEWAQPKQEEKKEKE
ncbi:MAG: hypothetical protein RR842_04855 [Gordonibacter sp.]|uniref:hypothetical protein n=1 Tax=Gordonibacter sp. TaxID=1968902 RepID=UPI002B3BE04F|nr:hypothetical protein [Gordonibacter sp.]